MGHEVNGPGEGNVAQGTGNMCYQFRLNCAHEATSIGQSVTKNAKQITAFLEFILLKRKRYINMQTHMWDQWRKQSKVVSLWLLTLDRSV